jgi:hypothetical protein
MTDGPAPIRCPALRDPSSSVAQGVDGAANVITAAICTITGNQPYAALLLVDDQRAGGQALIAQTRADGLGPAQVTLRCSAARST